MRDKTLSGNWPTSELIAAKEETKMKPKLKKYNYKKGDILEHLPEAFKYRMMLIKKARMCKNPSGPHSSSIQNGCLTTHDCSGIVWKGIVIWVSDNLTRKSDIELFAVCDFCAETKYFRKVEKDET